MNKKAAFGKQPSKSLKNTSNLLLLCVYQLKDCHDKKIKTHKFKLYLNYFAMLNCRAFLTKS